MVIPSVLLGLLPGYHILGYISILGLLFSRFLQGVSNGGEYITNAIYLTELARTRKQVPLLSSFTSIGGVSGVGLGLIFAYTLRTYLGQEAFNHYGWRIPFLSSSLLAAYAMYLRKNLPETHLSHQPETETLTTLLSKHSKAVIQSFFIALHSCTLFWIVLTYLTVYDQEVLHITYNQIQHTSIISMLLTLVSIVCGAQLASRLGMRKILLVSTVLFFLLSIMLKMCCSFTALSIVSFSFMLYYLY